MRAIVAFTLLLLSTEAGATTIQGSAQVIDGDTLHVSAKRVRLFGIDAPEATQSCDRNGEKWACGQASGDHLRSLIGASELTCTGNETDTYGRLVAVCSIDGVDLNRTMVADGWATAFRRYSETYVADETRARAGKLGLWSSSFMAPADYRAAERERAAPPVRLARARAVVRSSASACLIKGNHSRRGEWIYHLPGMPYYEQTRAEQMFCTEAEAQAAGYRRSRAQ